MSFAAIGLTFHAGKLYHASGALDPMTGKPLLPGTGDKKTGSFKTKHMLWGLAIGCMAEWFL